MQEGMDEREMELKCLGLKEKEGRSATWHAIQVRENPKWPSLKYFLDFSGVAGLGKFMKLVPSHKTWKWSARDGYKVLTDGLENMESPSPKKKKREEKKRENWRGDCLPQLSRRVGWSTMEIYSHQMDGRGEDINLREICRRPEEKRVRRVRKEKWSEKYLQSLDRAFTLSQYRRRQTKQYRASDEAADLKVPR